MDARNDSPPPLTLEYAPALPFYRRAAARRVIIILVLAFLAGFAFKILPGVVHRARASYWQRQCLRFELPPDSVMLADDMPAAETPWSRFSRELPSLIGRNAGVAFLHERVSPCGNRRLVVVELHRMNNLVLGLPRVFTVGSFLSFPKESSKVSDPWGFQPASQHYRIYDLQPDRSEASHFSFRYDYEGFTGLTVDGWLHDDDSVVLQVRPSVNPPPPPSSAPSR